VKGNHAVTTVAMNRIENFKDRKLAIGGVSIEFAPVSTVRARAGLARQQLPGWQRYPRNVCHFVRQAGECSWIGLSLAMLLDMNG
jgi:hypothetical protein